MTTEREQFEAWARETFGSYVADRNPDGTYAAIDVRLSWFAWQAALAQPAQPSTLSAPELSDAECDAIHARLRAEYVRNWNISHTDHVRALIRAGHATVAENAARWHIVGELVDRQAEDEGLWFVAQTAPEDYLQRELRYLHAAIDAARGKS